MKRYIIIPQNVMDKLIIKGSRMLKDAVSSNPNNMSIYVNEIPACPWASGVFEILDDNSLKEVLSDWDTTG